MLCSSPSITGEMAVERGVGIAFVSEMVAARSVALGQLKTIELDGLDQRHKIHITRNVTVPFTSAQSVFWKFAIQLYDRLNTEIWESLVNFVQVP